jgi:DNA-directed RNA polymerase subunit RPC12/RpoP
MNAIEGMRAIFNAPNIVCPKCGGKLFREVVALKKLSALLSPTGQEERIPIPFYACINCGTIPEEETDSRNYKLIMGEESGDPEGLDELKEEQKPSIILPGQE